MPGSEAPSMDSQIFGDEASYPALALSDQPTADSPRTVRGQIEALRPALGAELTDDVLLVASELVANAVFHAATPFSFRLRFCPRGVVVLIEDGSLDLPVIQRSTDPLQPRGRGLELVSKISSQYGYSTSMQSGLKLVWAVVPWTRD